MNNIEWLEKLERESVGISLGDVVLWGGSVVSDMQTAVESMYGVSDLNNGDDSRPSKIVSKVREIVGDTPFSIIDICCGDALVLWKIKRAFPVSNCLGVDMNKGNTQLYDIVTRDGVRIFRTPMQSVFSSPPPLRFDFSMMLNTYRGWGAAKLRDGEATLPNLADRWLAGNSVRSILTATDEQIARLMASNAVTEIGRGEQDSRMILVEWGQ